ncbi:MAG: hypothetical protein HY754_14245 [Nitrospirae bacterium]|nr:hypothetical protein [Nitrospirota bacterium]
MQAKPSWIASLFLLIMLTLLHQTGQAGSELRMIELRCHIVKTPGEGLYSLIAGDADTFVYPEQIVALSVP